MDVIRLGKSGLIVSRVGLGTMNFGSQLGEAECHAMMDCARDHAINFIDVAEMYASPPSPETYGLSEQIVGTWLAKQPRDRVIVASKIVGPADGRFKSGQHIRGGTTALDRHHIARAVEDSLKRLRTDYIDLYQFHWPDRRTPLEVQLDAMDRMVRAGKVRYFGTSNETAWGLMRLIATAEKLGTVAPVSIQNVLNLIETEDYEAVRETCEQENVGYIAFSPLAMGLLSGKYADGALPEGSRFALYERYRLKYSGANLQARVRDMMERARRAGVTPAEYAFAWTLSRPAVAVVLSSGSNTVQLEAMIRASGLTLDFDQKGSAA